jgi:hypothetical protein
MGPTATDAAVRPDVDPRRRRPRSGSVSRQIAQQRRGYAGAVLRALARSHRGRPSAVVQRVLREALTPLGVRLSGAELHNLAAGIRAGKPVARP